MKKTPVCGNLWRQSLNFIQKYLQHVRRHSAKLERVQLRSEWYDKNLQKLAEDRQIDSSVQYIPVRDYIACCAIVWTATEHTTCNLNELLITVYMAIIFVDAADRDTNGSPEINFEFSKINRHPYCDISLYRDCVFLKVNFKLLSHNHKDAFPMSRPILSGELRRAIFLATRLCGDRENAVHTLSPAIRSMSSRWFLQRKGVWKNSRQWNDQYVV